MHEQRDIRTRSKQQPSIWKLLHTCTSGTIHITHNVPPVHTVCTYVRTCAEISLVDVSHTEVDTIATLVQVHAGIRSGVHTHQPSGHMQQLICECDQVNQYTIRTTDT